MTRALTDQVFHELRGTRLVMARALVDQDDLQSLDEATKDWVKAWHREVCKKKR